MRTVTPGNIVSVTSGTTVIVRSTIYTASVAPHVVSDAISSITIVSAKHIFALTSITAKNALQTIRFIATLYKTEYQIILKIFSAIQQPVVVA